MFVGITTDYKKIQLEPYNPKLTEGVSRNLEYKLKLFIECVCCPSSLLKDTK